MTTQPLPTAAVPGSSSSDNSVTAIIVGVVAVVTVIVLAATILIAIALILRSCRAEYRVSQNQK